MKCNLFRLVHRIIKILFIILTASNFFVNISYSDENITCKQSKKNKIEKIIVEINKHKLWTKNNIQILISNTRTIPAKFKKRFKGKIKIYYTDGSLCILNAKVRQNGDFKDHIFIFNNNIKQSIDVQLINGNIDGITRFKLFLDGTRGTSQDEIFLTELLRELNFISPRTQFVEAYINGIGSTMLLQEKSTKEMLEYHGKIESAIFEANENDLYKISEKYSNNNLSITEIGLDEGFHKALMGQFARQSNSKWSLKSPMHREISLRALSYLNLVYINFSNNFSQNSNYNFDNTLLGKQNKKNIIKLDKFNLILRATNASHGLLSNNRKFYWNKLENYFEPIYYDGDTTIYKNENLEINLPFSLHISEALNELEHSLGNIDLNKLKEKLNNRKLSITDKDIQQKIIAINYNLSKLKSIINNYDSKLVKSNRKLKIGPEMIEKNMINKKKINSGAIFVFKEISQKFNNYFLICDDYNNCKKTTLKEQEQEKLLSGNLFENSHEYIYVGYYPDLKINTEIEKFNFVHFENEKLNFYYNDGIKFNFNKEKDEFNIFQLKSEARAYFMNSNLKNIDINFIGFKNFDNLFFLPFDLKGLTGCLTFFNSSFKNVNLKSQDSNCEDSINMVNVIGQINNIEITNSYSDSLDIDFSNISIKNTIIKNSKNDCVDVSAGIYNFESLVLDGCEDKGLSVGEKSSININNINISNSKIGIASKDGSNTNIFSSNIKNVNTCLASYNKKQEFSGGNILIEKFQCDNFIKKNLIDPQSSIQLIN
ncbi:hypothetical protein OAQ73_01650 [Candidatus Pelagibacter sp.]|nr:hypothetical protein [Candidatus Pelagibacter sp.]